MNAFNTGFKTKTIPDTTVYLLKKLYGFFRKNWIGTSVILLATIVFFWPVITQAGTYNPGGDGMFNAWTLARDQHCILRQNCPNYDNGNIFYPNKNSMLYSESQLSAGILTMPLYFINQNPNFSNNVWTIISFFFCGWFMYLLAKFLSRDNEFYAVLIGLTFAFGPIILAELVHLQNLSIFYLPLITLFILKYIRQPARKYLVGLFISLVLLFYASWYQMVFGLIAFGVLLLFAWALKLVKFKQISPLIITILLAILMALPLAVQYVNFSKQTGAKGGSAHAQSIYSSSVDDYFIPYKGTILGNIYYKIRPTATVNTYSADGVSYSGITLYLIALIMLCLTFIKRKSSKAWNVLFKWVVTFIAISFAGLIVSLGPFLKIDGKYLHTFHSGLLFVIVLPYAVVDTLLPQLDFIRAINRSSIVVLFGLCCILAMVPVVMDQAKIRIKLKIGLSFLILILIIVEFMPLHAEYLSTSPYVHNMTIPKVYKYIKNTPAVNDIVVLYPDSQYPGTAFLPAPFLNGVFEQVLWAGYDNKNIFNGYSGYFPPNYDEVMNEFDNFKPSDIALMKSFGLKYILVDKLLSSSEPLLVNNIASTGSTIVYHDPRFVLFKIH